MAYKGGMNKMLPSSKVASVIVIVGLLGLIAYSVLVGF